MNLKQIREEKEYTQPEIVDYLKIVEPRMTVPLLSIIEAGAVLTNKETLKALCHFFGVNPSDIYTESEMNLSNCLGREVAVSVKKVDRHRRAHYDRGIDCLNRLISPLNWLYFIWAMKVFRIGTTIWY